MPDVRRRDVLKLAGGAAGVGLVGTGVAAGGPDCPEGRIETPERGDPRVYDDYTTRRVPEDFETISAAVSAADPRDLVLVGPGVYEESVVVGTPDLTIRGTDRNAVVLDGGFSQAHGFDIEADGVVVENLTARQFTANGVYWDGVDGYRGSYLTAYNNGRYGIYAFDSVNGRFDHSYASGHPDSGFYIGQCQPCKAVIEDVVAERNAIGYSGTNAGGQLVVRDSTWRANMGGIVPNTLDSEALAPQRRTRVEGNEVVGNNNEDAPTLAIGYPAFGTGINLAGGRCNEVVDNVVRDHVNFGIVVTPMIDENWYSPAGNRVAGNVVENSGRADLALGGPAGAGNEFVGNEAGTARPGGIRGGALGALGGRVGDPWVTLLLGKAFLQTQIGSHPGGNFREVPAPGDRPGMDDPTRPSREPVGPEVGG